MNAFRVCLFLIATACCFLAQAVETPTAGPAIRRATRQSQFTIPFSLDRPSEEVAAVRLFVSVDQGKSWQVANSQPPTSGKFTFRARGDAVYWFASRTIDHQHRAWPQEPMRAELEVWVDTSQPQVELRPRPAGDQVSVAWSAWDPLLDPKTIQLEYLDGGQWRTATLKPRRTGGRLEGVVAAPASARQFRIAASDQAGNRTVLSRQLEASGGSHGSSIAQTPAPRPPGPDLPSGIPADPMQQLRGMASHDAPSNDSQRSATVARLPPPEVSLPQPANTSDPSDNWLPRTEAFAAGPRQPWPATTTSNSSSRAPSHASTPRPDGTASGGVRPNGSEVAASPTHRPVDRTSPFTSSPPESDNYRAVPSAVSPALAARTHAARVSDSAWRADSSTNLPDRAGGSAGSVRPEDSYSQPPTMGEPNLPQGVRPQWTNRTRFNIDYQLDSILPENVGDVELWATSDHGATWSKWGNDPDHVSPVSIKIEEPGVYGFHVVVVSRRGMASVTPKSAADADVWIGVDVSPPRAEVTSATIADGANAGRLHIQWTADDPHLADLPIQLFYGPSTSGPWTSLATDIDNTGSYYWQPTPAVPEQIHLKLTVKDQAGNVTEHVVPDSVRIESLRPRANIRMMKPITGASTQIDAAEPEPVDREARANIRRQGV